MEMADLEPDEIGPYVDALARRIAKFPADSINACKQMVYKKEVALNANVCPKCDYHFRIGARDRIAMMMDPGSWEEFDGDVPDQDAQGFLKLLRPVLDFEQRSADEMYLDSIEPEYRESIERQEVIEGMDRDMTLLALGKPDRKVRDVDEDGVETEDWIYGKPPGEIVFVTFEEGVVIAVKHTHANLGGQVSERKPIER